MSNSVQSHRRQTTRLPRPWDSPGKNTGVGCHFLLQCMKVNSESEVAQSCPTLSDPMDCSFPGPYLLIYRAGISTLHLYIYICIGEGNGNPLQCSCLENPRGGGAWWAAVYGVAQSQTRLKRLSRCIQKYYLKVRIYKNN